MYRNSLLPVEKRRQPSTNTYASSTRATRSFFQSPQMVHTLRVPHTSPNVLCKCWFWDDMSSATVCGMGLSGLSMVDLASLRQQQCRVDIPSFGKCLKLLAREKFLTELAHHCGRVDKHVSWLHSKSCSSFMLPPSFLATPLALKRHLVFDCLPNDEFLAVPALDAPIIPSSDDFSVISVTVRSRFFSVSRERLQQDVVSWTFSRRCYRRVGGEAEVVVAEAGAQAFHERLQIGYRG